MKRLWLLIPFLISTLSCTTPTRKPSSVRKPAGSRNEKIEIKKLKDYPFQENFPSKFFVMNSDDVLNYQLHISSAVTMNQKSPTLRGRVTCDDPFELRTAKGWESHPGPALIDFDLSPSSWTNGGVDLKPSLEVTECRVYLQDPAKPEEVFGFRLIPRDLASQAPGEQVP